MCPNHVLKPADAQPASTNNAQGVQNRREHGSATALPAKHHQIHSATSPHTSITTVARVCGNLETWTVHTGRQHMRIAMLAHAQNPLEGGRKAPGSSACPRTKPQAGAEGSPEARRANSNRGRKASPEAASHVKQAQGKTLAKAAMHS